jgi:hypothetical protein
MLNSVSTRPVRAVLFAAAVLPVIACVDPKGRFDEYDERLPHIDASTIDAPMVDEIPNVDGDWLLAVDPSIAMGLFVQIKVTWDVTATGDTGVLDGSYQPLVTYGNTPPVDAPGRVPVGDAILANDVPVNNTASFSARLVGLLPGNANPVSGTPFDIDVTLNGTIQSMDVVCGIANGTVGPLDVTGSTWAAVRYTGTDAPVPIGRCPAATTVDAGVDAP